eukprot:Nk52_evm1s2628 gene=Nk52_evmTU1s2628
MHFPFATYVLLSGSSPTGLIDFKKAFDKVPHSAINHVLKSKGIHGSCLKYIENLYSSSFVGVPGAEAEDFFRQMEGVRQGCPMSPIIFNLYIDTLLNEHDSVGFNDIDTSIPGLQLADDSAILTSTQESLQTGFDKVNEWCSIWGMSMNPKKCGTMVVGGSEHDVNIPIPNAHTPVHVNGEDVPIVDEYKYLGVNFHYTLDWGEIISLNVTRGKDTMKLITYALKQKCLPTYLKLRIYNSLLISRLTYGAELFGIAPEKYLLPLITIAEEALRHIAGMHTKAKALYNMATIYMELDTTPLLAILRSRPVRLLGKYFDKHETILSELLHTQHEVAFQRPHRERKALGNISLWASKVFSIVKKHVQNTEFDPGEIWCATYLKIMTSVKEQVKQKVILKKGHISISHDNVWSSSDHRVQAYLDKKFVPLPKRTRADYWIKRIRLDNNF